MSKIIKANFVVEKRIERFKKTEQNGKILAISERDNMYLTKETADSLYLETKIMLEELVAQAQQRADAIILKAKEEAQSILEATRGDISNNKVESWDKGYQQGYSAGHEEAQGELKQRYGQIEAVLRELEGIRKELLVNQQNEIVELIILLTEKILGSIVDFRPEVIVQIVRNVLEKVREAEKITVKINSVHSPYLNSSDFKNAGLEHVEVIENPSISPGNCQVITENGFIDAIIEEQLMELKRVLMETSDGD